MFPSQQCYHVNAGKTRKIPPQTTRLTEHILEHHTLKVGTALRVIQQTNVVFADQPSLNQKTADGRLMTNLQASISAYYADTQSEKMKKVVWVALYVSF